MKAVIVVMTAIALSLVFTPAYGDDVGAMPGRDLGIELYESSRVFVAATAVSETGPVAEVYKELGIELYESALADERTAAEMSAKGRAAGGIGAAEAPVKEAEISRIRTTYLGPGGSDLP